MTAPDGENRIISQKTATRIFELADVLTRRERGVYETQLAQIATTEDHRAGNLEKALVAFGTSPEIARQAIHAHSMPLDETFAIMRRVNGEMNSSLAGKICGQILLQGLQELYPTETFVYGRHNRHNQYGEEITVTNDFGLYRLTEHHQQIHLWGWQKFLRKRKGKSLIEMEKRVSSEFLGDTLMTPWDKELKINITSIPLLHALDHKKGEIEKVLLHTEGKPGLKTTISIY